MCLELTDRDWLTYRLSPGEHRFIVTLHLRVEPWEISPIYIHMSVDAVIFQVLFGRPYRRDVMETASLSYIEYTNLQQAPGSLAVMILPSPLLWFSLNLRWVYGFCCKWAPHASWLFFYYFLNYKKSINIPNNKIFYYVLGGLRLYQVHYPCSPHHSWKWFSSWIILNSPMIKG